jgi:hypothetical protein
MLAKLGDLTDNGNRTGNVDLETSSHNNVINAILDADCAIANGRIEVLEKESKVMNLMIAEKDLEINNLNTMVEGMTEEIKRKDDALEINVENYN